MLFTRKPASPIDAASALPGRAEEMRVPERHEVLGTPLKGPFPSGVDTAGWHSVKVSLKNTRGDITARPGYSR